MARLSVRVRGVVQGVGFRPFVYRAARARKLGGFVQNRRDAVEIEVEGGASALEDFVSEIRDRMPLPVRIASVEVRELADLGVTEFDIRESSGGHPVAAALPADLATCLECRREIETPGERRYRYPFTNCTSCGPRYSIVEALPYDRARTSMKGFELCGSCASEYRDPENRRFHAQPIACPACGPTLSYLDATGKELERGEPALSRAAELIKAGRILALRGLGGFQLAVDATNEAAVVRLRERKHREEKPFALMFVDLDALLGCAAVSPAEARALGGPEGPIVLLRREPNAPLAPSIAPGNPNLGVMVAYTPLHRLLLADVGRPIVCTSGNFSEEPMCIDVDQALARLAPIADGFLVHDRPIVRPVDDSVGRVGPFGLELLRRARGFAPEPVARIASERSVLALGAHMKSTIAIAISGSVIVSQHLGDLENVESERLLERTVDDFVRFFELVPDVVACDQHPDYASTRLGERIARELAVPLIRVQHHHAHIAAVQAEHDLAGPVLGLAWDGTGWGPDETIWGGEALVCVGATSERVAFFEPFALPGGGRAAREPRRAALGLIAGIDPGRAEALAERWYGKDGKILLKMIASGPNAPKTSSVGRLFDAVAGLLELRTRCSFEAQAAIELEFLAEAGEAGGGYPFDVSEETPAIVSFRRAARALLSDLDAGIAKNTIAARFHRTLIEIAVAIAVRVGLPDVVLAGGCFQNAILSRGCHQALARAGFRVFTCSMLPPNDGSISVGQAFVAAHLGA